MFLVISAIGVYALYIFCKKAKDGFGPYTTSTFLLMLVIITAALLVIGDNLNERISSILFAVLGFAGGLFARAKNPKRKSNTNSNITKDKS